MTLSAFAAERHAAAPLLLRVRRSEALFYCLKTLGIDRYLVPARRSASNPPHAAAAVE